jgi:hydrogenase nickel incorporation protein HypB
MCGTCGCGEDNTVRIQKPGGSSEQHNHTHSHPHTHDDTEHTHDHLHGHSHKDQRSHDDLHSNQHAHSYGHSHDHSHGSEILIEQDILHKNNLLAERNRGYFEAKNIFALNLVSSPGSGKTSLLERSIKELGKEISFFVIEGDQQTMNDANRINEAGAPVVQVNTGSGCHLDSDMVNKAVKELDVKENSVLVIENVGNLVCPAMFDLGESKRVVIISVTEGDDKPIKYPAMFASSHLCIINKTDLLPYVDFDIEKVKEYALQVNHHLEIIELSVKTGEGMDKWYDWVNLQSKKLNS